VPRTAPTPPKKPAKRGKAVALTPGKRTPPGKRARSAPAAEGRRVEYDDGADAEERREAELDRSIGREFRQRWHAEEWDEREGDSSNLSYEQRALIAYIAPEESAGRAGTKSRLADMLGIHRDTLSAIIDKRDTILAGFADPRCCRCPLGGAIREAWPNLTTPERDAVALAVSSRTEHARAAIVADLTGIPHTTTKRWAQRREELEDAGWELDADERKVRADSLSQKPYGKTGSTVEQAVVDFWCDQRWCVPCPGKSEVSNRYCRKAGEPVVTHPRHYILVDSEQLRQRWNRENPSNTLGRTAWWAYRRLVYDVTRIHLFSEAPKRSKYTQNPAASSRLPIFRHFCHFCTFGVGGFWLHLFRTHCTSPSGSGNNLTTPAWRARPISYSSSTSTPSTVCSCASRASAAAACSGSVRAVCITR
jgi:hypothetical protein